MLIFRARRNLAAALAGEGLIEDADRQVRELAADTARDFGPESEEALEARVGVAAVLELRGKGNLTFAPS